MKFVKTLLTAGVITAISAASVYAANPIKVFVDNSEVAFEDQAPELVNGRTLVPIRAVFEKAGAAVEWDGETKIATLKKGDYTVTIKLGESYLTKNGVPIAIDVPACILNDRLSIPVRAISEAMDFGVTWNSTRGSVLINTSGKEYRPNTQWKTGFLSADEAGFIVNERLDDLNYFDLNGDGTTDTIGFIPSVEKEDGTIGAAGIWVAGQDVSSVLDKKLMAYGVGVVDFVDTDEYKEIVVLYNSDDGRSLGVYRFNGVDLFQVSANNSNDGMISFYDRVFVDGKENVVSDIDGLCFLNDMICTGVYSLESGEFNRYLWKPDSTINKTYKRIYQDNRPLSYKEVSSYNKGKYVDNVVDNEMISSDDIAGFKVLDYYVDEKDPSKYEFYISLPDGTKAVIWPFVS